MSDNKSSTEKEIISKKYHDFLKVYYPDYEFDVISLEERDPKLLEEIRHRATNSPKAVCLIYLKNDTPPYHKTCEVLSTFKRGEVIEDWGVHEYDILLWPFEYINNKIFTKPKPDFVQKMRKYRDIIEYIRKIYPDPNLVFTCSGSLLHEPNPIINISYANPAEAENQLNSFKQFLEERWPTHIGNNLKFLSISLQELDLQSKTPPAPSAPFPEIKPDSVVFSKSTTAVSSVQPFEKGDRKESQEQSASNNVNEMENPKEQQKSANTTPKSSKLHDGTDESHDQNKPKGSGPKPQT